MRACKIVDFVVPADHRIKLKECEKKDKYFDLARELKKLWNIKVSVVPIVIGAFGTVTEGLLKGLEDLEVGYHPNNSIIENGQNTEKSPRDLRKLDVTQTPVKNHSANADVKNSNRVNNNNNNKTHGNIEFKQCVDGSKAVNHIISEYCTAINKLSIIWKSDLTDKMKRSFFQAAIISVVLYGCTTWTLTKRLEKKLDGNYTSMLRAILNKSWRQHPTKHQLYGHLPPITKTIIITKIHISICIKWDY